MKNREKKSAQAWTRYWSEADQASPGCLPELPSALADHVLQIWEKFLRPLPHGAQLLDLGTGNGSVLIQAKACRPDLSLTGVDYATTLPDLGNSITLHPKIRMEELPFNDGSFNAISSQFALEYGNVAAIMKEVRRVLAAGGSYLFLCHHADGVIVRDNIKRLAAIRDVLSHTGLIETAIKAMRKRKKSTVNTRQRLARIFDAARIRHAGQSVVNEVAEEIARMMAQPNSLKKLLHLRNNVDAERQRLSALKKAALTARRAGEITDLLHAWRYPAHLDVVYVPEIELPFAWKISNAT